MKSIMTALAPLESRCVCVCVCVLPLLWRIRNGALRSVLCQSDATNVTRRGQWGHTTSLWVATPLAASFRMAAMTKASLCCPYRHTNAVKRCDPFVS